MILANTNVFAELTKPDPDRRVVRWYARHRRDIALCAVVAFEVMAGVEALRDRARRKRVGAAYSSLFGDLDRPSLVLDDQAARLAAVLQGDARRGGVQMKAQDALIAGIAKRHRVELATRNTKDFRATGLTLIDPWNAP